MHTSLNVNKNLLIKINLCPVKVNLDLIELSKNLKLYSNFIKRKILINFQTFLLRLRHNFSILIKGKLNIFFLIVCFLNNLKSSSKNH